jgi:uncharacterized protein involved in exopolysaccharide biosynthesis
VVYRAIDVVFQYLKPLIALLVVIPLAVGGFAFAFGRADVVSARVWADRPVFTPDFTSDLYSSTYSPAQVESALMLELIGTDSFATGVENVVQPEFESWSTPAQAQAFAALRQAFSVDPQGEHLFVISYTSTQPVYGIRVLQAIIQNYGSAVTDIESTQVGAAAGTLQALLPAAQQAMNQAVSAAQTYKAQHHLSDQDAQSDPNYGTLLAQARSQTDNYLRLLAQVDAAQSSQQAALSVPAAMFHVVDPPAVVHEALISSRTPGLKQAGLALGVVAALEALLVYVAARRDPTIRSGEEIRRALGLKPLGSVPLLR